MRGPLFYSKILLYQINIMLLVGSKVNILKKENIKDITIDEVKNNLAFRD